MLSMTGFVYCPRCGKAEMEDHEVKAARCRACGFIYFHNPAAAVAVIIENQGKLLLERRKVDPQSGKLDLPGGFVDYEESFETAAIREVREELGIAISGLRYLGSFPNRYSYRGVTYFTTDVVFTCSLGGSFQGTLEEKEVAEVVALAPHEINLDEVAFISMRRALETYLERLNAGV